MEDLLIIMAIGCLLALLGSGVALIARWCELRSTTSAWAFPVSLMRGVAGLLLGLAAIALLSLNVLALVLLLTAWIMEDIARRRIARESLVWILALTTARKMPLAPSVSAYALECSGGYRWRVLRLAQRLQAGQPLHEVMARDRANLGGLLTNDGAAAVCVGAACGDLAGALCAAARTSDQRRPFWHELGMRGVYLAQLLAVTLGVTTGFLFFIMPALIKILGDFGAELPRSTQMLVDASEAAPTMLLLLVLALLAVLPFVLLFMVLMQWDWPGFGAWLRRRHTPALLRALAGVIERAQPLSDAIGALAGHYPVRPVRSRLKRVAESYHRGATGWQCWFDHGLLPAADAAVLDAAERVGNLPWALRTLADSQERRRGYRLQVAMQFFWPVAILAIGLAVGFIVIAGMLPLIDLIERLA